MRLIVDVGNTNVKLAVFEGGKICKVFIERTISHSLIEKIMNIYPTIDMVFSCTSNNAQKLEKIFFSNYKVRFVEFNTNIYKDIFSSYNGTLGEDRSALSIGGIFFYGKNILVIDLGTCITYDLVLNGIHKGGQISPGITSRLQNLYNSTESLPMVDFEVPNDFVGESTKECMMSGVFFGVLSELELMIKRYINEYKLTVVITGGDAKYVKKHIKNVIFDDNLLMKGLNCMLNENIKV